MNREMRPFTVSSFKIGGNTFQPKQLNIIVGPNNAGKSRLLKSIRNEILGLEVNNERDDTSIKLLFPRSAKEFIEDFHVVDHLKLNVNGHYSLIDYCSCGLTANQNGYERMRVNSYGISINWQKEIADWFEQDCPNIFCDSNYELRRRYGAMFVNFCSTEDRLLLAAGEQYFARKDEGTNTLSWSMSNPSIMDKVSAESRRVFGRDIALDIRTRGGYIIPKCSNSFERYRESQHSNFDEEELLSLSDDLADEGDGIKSFFSVATAIAANTKPVILIDEPEAHLHPPQAYELGKIIAQGAFASNGTQTFIATHSPRLLNGLIAGSPDMSNVAIYRLSRENKTPNCSSVDRQQLEKLMRKPVLKSGRHFEGIFSHKTILVESEADELVYQAIATRSFDESDVLFLNVHGKAQFHTSVDFYNCIGSQYGIICDLDLINNVDTMQTLGKSLGFNESELRIVAGSGAIIHDKLYDSSIEDSENATELYKKKFKRYDPSVFREVEDEVDLLIQLFEKHHCLILKTGELETALESFLDASANKSSWAIQALDKLETLGNEEIFTLSIAQRLQKCFSEYAALNN